MLSHDRQHKPVGSNIGTLSLEDTPEPVDGTDFGKMTKRARDKEELKQAVAHPEAAESRPECTPAMGIQRLPHGRTT